jgi:hypothetical protein
MKMYDQKNYYISSLRASDQLTNYKTVEFGDIYLRIGQTEKGSLIIQSLLFPKSRYNFSRAQIVAHQLSKMM